MTGLNKMKISKTGECEVTNTSTASQNMENM